jgi:hypothetical protein
MFLFQVITADPTGNARTIANEKETKLDAAFHAKLNAGRVGTLALQSACARDFTSSRCADRRQD